LTGFQLLPTLQLPLPLAQVLLAAWASVVINPKCGIENSSTSRRRNDPSAI
jgi:hypothetical protein